MRRFVTKGRSVFGLSLLVVLALAGCETPKVISQPTALDTSAADKAVVILAVDFRERTSLRSNIAHMGKLYFRKVDAGYGTRPPNDFDFVVDYSLAASWRAIGSDRDENRVARILQINPGKYVIERIEIGAGPAT